MPASLIDQIVTRLRKVPVNSLPGVLAAIEGASKSKKGGAGKKGKAAALDEIARRALELDVSGSKLDEVERAIVAHALMTAEGNIAAAARLVGIDRKAMERRIVGYGIRRP